MVSWTKGAWGKERNIHSSKSSTPSFHGLLVLPDVPGIGSKVDGLQQGVESGRSFGEGGLGVSCTSMTSVVAPPACSVAAVSCGATSSGSTAAKAEVGAGGITAAGEAVDGGVNESAELTFARPIVSIACRLVRLNYSAGSLLSFPPAARWVTAIDLFI
ncbi:hypothetical protein BC629DRAFT_987682 [Irpex lacteus]|nr:hypothetical protein BC629DRAFT_987682 [Irpex lacteus]